jgi:hypothetical protein
MTRRRTKQTRKPPKRAELVRRLAAELRRSRVPERTIGDAVDAVSIIMCANKRRQA